MKLKDSKCINLMEKDEEIRLISEVLAKVKKTTFAEAFANIKFAKRVEIFTILCYNKK